ncbi:MAG: hypothetical protein E3J23_02200 [Candidatus Stahlbacteria bacterium]|nr:MAG: hypothetical protein E3J23_02200 [Candidatus Stahlbacteria bacterium]
MKRIYLFIVVSIILVFSLLSCYEIAAPEVQIWWTSPLAWDVYQFDLLFDSSYTSDVRADSVTFWVRNGVDAKLLGYYAEFYQVTRIGEENIFLYQGLPYPLELNLRAAPSRKDTVRTSLFNWSIHVREAVEEMYGKPETEWQSILVRVHFFGEDAYGEGKEFNVTHDYTLIRID